MIGKTNSVIVSGGEDRLKKLLDTLKSTNFLFSNYNGTSVDDLIQYSDTENVTAMSHMFDYCRYLNPAPLLDTSNVTDMSGMFYDCWAITTIPQYNTSNVTNMRFMFYNDGKLRTIPLLDTSNVTNMGCMFYSCKELTTIPQLNTSNVTNMNSMFRDCTHLTTVPALDVSRVTDMSDMFIRCTLLKSILMTHIGANLDIHYSTKFEREDLLVILNNLETVTSSKTLTMGATNLAKLTDEDKAIATNKGWTLA